MSALQGAGIDLRGPLIGIYSFTTVVIFCEGLGIATAKALIEATAGVGGLSFPLRRDVRMYYRVRVPGPRVLCILAQCWIYMLDRPWFLLLCMLLGRASSLESAKSSMVSWPWLSHATH